MDLGGLPKFPVWVFKLFFWLAIVGVFAITSGFFYGLGCLLAHLHWK